MARALNVRRYMVAQNSECNAAQRRCWQPTVAEIKKTERDGR